MILVAHPEDPDLHPRAGLRYLGYWQPPGRTRLQLPNPADFIEHTWDFGEWEMVRHYVAIEYGHEVLHSWLGSSRCRLCGQRPCGPRPVIEGTPRSVCLTDGVYAWPGGFVHYITEHGVRPPQEFVDHVRARVLAIG